MSSLVSLLRHKPNSIVCLTCGELEPVDDGNIESPFKAVCAAAKKGCESCSLLRHAIHDCLPQAVVEDAQNSVYVIVRRSILREFVEIAVRFGQGATIVVLDLFVSPNTFSPWKSVRVGIETSGNTVSLPTFHLVEKWLSNCLDNHQSCGAKSRSALPSRVLDLVSHSPDISLCEPSSKNERYACLSHCWGDSKTVTTVGANLETHKKAIAFSTLPRTFQEAVIFTQKLGIQYLWIDSLCIIQDDEDDWQKESAKMAQIYQNSYVTIAATGSGGPNEGLFSKHRKTKISGVFRDGTAYEVHARPVISHMDEAHFPLFKRGWVFQERLLAPRVLHFGRQELWWECLEMVECECSGIFGDRYVTGQEKFMSKLTHQAALSNSELPYVSRRWHAIVEEFSQLGLTKSRDKLPALSGIAQQISQLRTGTYLAGLWTDTLITDLLWYRIDPSSARHTEKWRCPTFSWASHDGPVQYFDAPRVLESPNQGVGRDTTQPLLATYLETIKVTSRLVSKNSFGEISSAHLLLKGILVPIGVFDARSRSSGSSTSTQTLGRRLFGLRRKGNARSNFEFRFNDNVTPLKYSFFADFDLRTADPGFTRAKYLLLRAAQDSYSDEYALVLQCIKPKQGICQRVGLFTPKFSPWRSEKHAELYYASFEKFSEPRELMLI